MLTTKCNSAGFSILFLYNSKFCINFAITSDKKTDNNKPESTLPPLGIYLL